MTGPRPTAPDGVLDHLRHDGDVIVPLAQRRTGRRARRHRGPRRPVRRAADPPDARPPRPAVAARRVRRPDPAPLVLPVPRHRPVLRGGHDRPRPVQLLRDARPAAAPPPRDPFVVAAASPLDRHGYFSLGVSADYTASFIGRARFFLEANPRMPRTFGRNQLHVSQVAGWCEVDRPLLEVAAGPERRHRRPHRRPRRRAHPRRRHHPGRHRRAPRTPSSPRSRATATSACTPSCSPTASSTSSRPASSTASASTSTAPRPSARSPSAPTGCTASSTTTRPSSCGRSATSTTPGSSPPSPASCRSTRRSRVDLLGQCASETIAGQYYSSSGGQADFARGAMYSEGGQGFVVLHSTTADGRISKISPDARRRRRRHDDQEHRRQGRHRVGRRRAARPLDPRAGDRAHRHRPSRPPRPPPPLRPPPRLPLTVR